jgi:hypothetical protein
MQSAPDRGTHRVGSVFFVKQVFGIRYAADIGRPRHSGTHLFERRHSWFSTLDAVTCDGNGWPAVFPSILDNHYCFADRLSISQRLASHNAVFIGRVDHLVFRRTAGVRMMGWMADKKQAWQDHRAAVDQEYIARGGIDVAELSGNAEFLQRAQQGLKDARTAKREASDRFWGWLVR